MGIAISEPTVPDKTVRTVTANSQELQVVLSAPHNRIPVAATLANSQVSIGSTAVNLNTHKPTGATHAEIACEGPIRFWDDGKTPTATQGKPLKGSIGNPVYYWVEAIDNFRVIAETGTVVIDISWYRYE